MNRIIIAITYIVLAVVIPSIAGLPAYAADVDHSAHVGERIHTATVDGYQLAYHLLDLPNNDAHHLMTYVVDPQGNPVTAAKVGYLVIGPDGKKQKVMAMGMKESFGGDVDFTVKGSYIVKTKVVVETDRLIDSFTYDVK